MKKWIPGLLALALLLSACGSPASERTPTPPEPTPTQTVEPTPAPEPTPSGPSVYTDWSKLEPYQPAAAVYTRRYEDFTDTLVPAGDYGLLVPFAGAALTETWGSWSTDYDLYGLMTLQGEIVVDPVFTGVSRLREWSAMMDDVRVFPVYTLQKAVVTENGPVERTALCALDGSWCTGFLYAYDWENPGLRRENDFLVIKKGEDHLAVLDLSDGRELWSIDLSPYLTDESYFGWQVSRDGFITVNLSQWDTERDIFLLFGPDGTLRLQKEGSDGLLWVGCCEEGLLPALLAGADPENKWEGSRYGYMDQGGNWLIDPVYQQAEPFENTVALVREQSGAWRFIDPTGTPVTAPIEAYSVWEAGDHWYFTSDTERPLAVYDRAGQPVEGIQNLATGRMEILTGGWVTAPAGEEVLLANGAEIHRFPAGLGEVSGVCEKGALLCTGMYETGNGARAVLVDWDGKELARWENFNYAYLAQDELTGESYVAVMVEEDDLRVYVNYYDCGGEFLVSDRDFDGYLTFYGSLACWNGESSTIFTDREGNVIFRWPIHSAMD